ncbi:uncharacterized protein LOC115241466 [Formica exsecta]|uniref:uncharacterized protein LOC115241466 n=1 Tax=Formica exsecta TaxID=72781 RepID=UPI0011440874|nr:uncharacterized protein LOC115241466 [Formica exsecta]XP_029673092.1 uncharacterized protein LOC115241466 [Formica exsecta]XP_029673093.1 uncharacterized protein LOC115241466 [Formica exsecta]
MATITHLPEDVIIIILEEKSISVQDIVNFKSTCKRFQQIILPNKFWERKYYYRCSTANKKYNVDKKKIIFNYLDFKEEINAGMKCMKKLQNYMLLMSEDKLRDTNKKELECLLRSIVEDSMLYYFLLDKQKRIIDAGLPWLNDLTYRYNFDLIFNCLKQYRFIYKISKFMNKPRKKRLLEELLTIIAQYFEPCISCSVIKTWLDNIAQEVLYRLKNKYPEHSIFMMSTEQLSFWRDNNIDDHFWDRTEEMQITEILITFTNSSLESLFVDKLCQLLTTLNIKNKYMNNVSAHFKNYLHVTICHCVARRLGIRCNLRPNSDDYMLVELRIERDLNAERLQTNERRDENSNSGNRSYNNIQIIRMMMAHFIQLTGNKKFYKWNLNILSEILSNYENIEEQNMNIVAQYRSITKTIKIAVEKRIIQEIKISNFRLE